ncbi:MAG: hypothetical protein AAB697_01535 [Patescibacteria group bacterium]
MAGKLTLRLTEFAVICPTCRFRGFKVGDSPDCDKCMGRAATEILNRGGNIMANPISDINPHRTPHVPASSQ